MLDYLKFIFNSTNHHGVHSPFVFKYLTECIYKPKVSKNKTEDVLLKSIGYFEYEKVFIENDGNLKNAKTQISNDKSQIVDHTNYDLVYVEFPTKSDIPFKKLHNDSMILMGNIRHTKNEWSVWKKLIKNDLITVSIDFYHCGVLFVRKEQVKEHFVLRL